jgi:hypothetical protein
MFQWAAENAIIYGTFLSTAMVLIFIFFYFFKNRIEMKLTLWTKSSKKIFLLLLFLMSFAFFVRLPFIWFNELSYDEPYYISASLLYMEGFSEGLGSDKFIANFEQPPIVKYAMGVFLKLIFPRVHLDYASLPNDDLLFYSRLFTVFVGSISVVPLFLLSERIKKNLGILASIFLLLIRVMQGCLV